MASEATTTQEGSLERLNIAVSTTAPDDLLTPNAIKAARFRKSKPWGILEQDVIDFQEIVKSAIAWYIEKLHQRDLDVHKLGKELDSRDTQITNLNLQLASASYNSGVKEAIDRNEEDKEMADLLARVATLQAEVAARDSHISDLNAHIADLGAADQAPSEPVAAGVDEATYAAAEQALLDAQAQLATLAATNHDLEAFIDQQENYIDTLLTQLQVEDDNTPDAPVEDDIIATPAEDVYEADEDDTTDVAPNEPEAEAYAPELDLENDPELALHPYEDPDGAYEETEEDEPEIAPEPEPAPSVAPEPVAVPVNPARANTPSPYKYNGIELPPGIRPEDL